MTTKDDVLRLVAKVLDDHGIDTPLGLALEILARESDVFLLVLRVGDLDVAQRAGQPRMFVTAGQGHSDRQLRETVTKWLSGKVKKS